MSCMGIPGASCGDGSDDIDIFNDGVDTELLRELLMSDIVLPTDRRSSLFLRLIFLNLDDCDPPLGLSDISSISTPDIAASLVTE